MAHGSRVVAVAFSPDGKWLATASYDETARVWDAATGDERAGMVHDAPVYAVAFSPDGEWLVTGSTDATARVWATHPETLIAEACARLTRNLTTQEWQRFFPGEPYRCTCLNLPPGGEEDVPMVLDLTATLPVKRKRTADENLDLAAYEKTRVKRAKQDYAATLRKQKRAEVHATRPLSVDPSGERGVSVVGIDVGAKTMSIFHVRIIGYQLDQTLENPDPSDDNLLVPVLDPACLEDWVVSNFLYPARRADATDRARSALTPEGTPRLARSTLELLPPEQRSAEDGKGHLAAAEKPKTNQKKKFVSPYRTKNFNTQLNVRMRFLRSAYADAFHRWTYLWCVNMNLMGAQEWPGLAIEVQPAPIMEKLGRFLKFGVALEDSRRNGTIDEPICERRILWRCKKGIERGTYTYGQRKKLAAYYCKVLCAKMGISFIFDRLPAVLKENEIDSDKNDDIADAFLIGLCEAMVVYNRYIKHNGAMWYSGQRTKPTQVKYRYIDYQTMIDQIQVPYDEVFARRKPRQGPTLCQ